MDSFRRLIFSLMIPFAAAGCQTAEPMDYLGNGDRGTDSASDDDADSEEPIEHITRRDTAVDTGVLDTGVLDTGVLDTDEPLGPRCWLAEEIPANATHWTCEGVPHPSYEYGSFPDDPSCCDCLSDELGGQEDGDWDNQECCGDCTAACGPWTTSCDERNRSRDDPFEY